MEHERAVNYLGDFVKGRIDEPDRSSLAEHLQTCEECADLVDVYRLFEGSLAEQDTEAEDAHPESDQIVAYAVKPETLAANDATWIASHLQSCDSCRLEIETTRQADETTRDARLRPGKKSVRSRVLFWSPIAAAAAVLLFVVGINVIDLPTTPPEPAYRSQPEQALRSLLDQDAALERASFVLRWDGPDGARYSIRIATEDLRVLDQVSGLSERMFHVPETLLADVPSGDRIVWQVEGRLPDGTRLPPLTAWTSVE